MLCPCHDCVDKVIAWRFQKCTEDAVKSLNHPPCPECGLPMIWRGLIYVCPYAETREIHARIKRQMAVYPESSAQSAQSEVRTTQGAERGAARGALLH
jgi:NAD-dependent SIR2 family protein deacetylase